MSSTPKKHSKRPTGLIVLGGLLILAAIVLASKPKSDPMKADLSLETRLDEALESQRPIFVFLHSLDCIPCQQMMEIVAQVYPEFDGSVVLIDVDVNDQRNINILRREALQLIPTLVFYDRQGQRYVQIGVLQADQLRDVLKALSEGN